MIKSKICTGCDKLKPLTEFYESKVGKYNRHSKCKKCAREISIKYYQEHQEERKKYSKNYQQEHKDKIRQKRGCKPMSENKLCPQYLGIVIAECLIRHLFNDVEVMPNNHSGYDIICNKGKKIDVKSACITTQNSKYPRWKFHIDYNTTADYFILVAFDNLTDLNPLHLWMIPGHILSKNSGKSIRPSTIHKWSEWEHDIEAAQMCCSEMKVRKINL